ncbi:unnamed protein product [Symbiodinium pilosum]|uniref:Transmembrane protein n=1 Tax=Symbiodinium pilosum TaxID=2952 RepID=A0A812QE55_SYMPI|nr:unnamed protein product [Symbiodinium pilosum]
MAHGVDFSRDLTHIPMVKQRHVWLPVVFILGLPLAFVSAATSNCVVRSGAASPSRSVEMRNYIGRTHLRKPDWMDTSSIFRQARAVGGPKGRRKDTKKQVQVQKERKKRD